MVAFVTSVLVSAVLFGIGYLQMQRRSPDEPATWGEAMVGAVFVFGTLFWVFGVVPHQWIQWADSELGWRADRFLVGPGDVVGKLPFDIPYTALRDNIVVAINVVYVAGWLKMWSLWQSRGKAEPVVETARSDYGRPLVKQDA